MGLIFTFHLQGRTEPLSIFGPQGLDEIITVQLRHSESVLNYVIHFHVLSKGGEVIFENEDIWVKTVLMNHRIPCFGFIFEEKLRKFKLLREKLPSTLSRENLAELKEGQDIVDNEGNFIPNADLAVPPAIPRKYAYLADTRYLEHDLPEVFGANLLYHEATFLSDMKSRAESTFHSTAAEAALFAARHQVKTLLIGHYSSRYFDLQPFLAEARPHFSETVLAVEGQLYDIKHNQLLESSENHAPSRANR